MQKLDKHYNVLRQFTIPSTSPKTHDMLENHGKHIIHCGGEYQSYLQIGVLK